MNLLTGGPAAGGVGSVVPTPVEVPRSVSTRDTSTRKVEPGGHLVADDLDAVGGEEADLEATLPAPPDRLVRGRHVDHGDHVSDLEKRKA